MGREITNKILEKVEAGELHPYTVVQALINYLSEDEVRECARLNELITDDELETE